MPYLCPMIWRSLWTKFRQLDEVKGTPVATYAGRTRRWSQDDLAGAVFLELALRGRLALDAAEQLVPSNTLPLGDNILDQALATFAQAAPTGDYRKWFDNIGARDMQNLVLQRLVQQGVLRQEERQILLAQSTVYPLAAPRLKQELKDRIHAILFGSAPLDQPTAALIVLLDACWLMIDNVIDKKEEKAYRKRFDQLFPDYLDWIADCETEMGTVLLDGVARPNSNAMSAVLVVLGNEFRV